MVIVLNGPPLSGKDTLAEYLSLQGYHHDCLKNSLYGIMSVITGIELEKVIFYCTNREYKEKPMSEFANKSPRQYLIHISEDVLKPLHGKDILGAKLAKRLKNVDSDIILSDGGYGASIEELLPVVQLVGHNNFIVIRVHREGCTFKGDTRAYLTSEYLDCYGIKSYDFNNNYSSIKHLLVGFEDFLEEIL